MNKSILIALFALVSCGVTQKSVSTEASLKDAFEDRFYIGTALNLNHIHGADTKGIDIVEKHFSSIVAENCMKSMFLQPQEGQFFFDDADKFVAFGEKNNQFIIGHTLIWHSQAPDWFFTDKDGNNVSAEVMKQRLKSHINTVVSRYKGRIQGWDVVNEAILEDGSYRKSKFYEILGEEFIPLAFQYAREADPEAELYYNDYNEWYPKKIETVTKLINDLRSSGIRIDGIGLQGHVGLDTPSIEEYEKTIVAYKNAGIKVSVTELEISALPSPWGTSANVADTVGYEAKMNPYTTGLPAEVQSRWEQRYIDFFSLFKKYQETVQRVTFWGVADGDSWKNDFPIVGRTDYPLLFDRNYQAKPVVKKLVELNKEK
ncbi:Endo-1,4-beta-xylanase A precursor [Flavobacteriaceae bacterium 3519-10]|nr:Endo-1,4-beta-xylanase A precursor [Flavobacteriaceae bacterium 3519-10]